METPQGSAAASLQGTGLQWGLCPLTQLEGVLQQLPRLLHPHPAPAQHLTDTPSADHGSVYREGCSC